MTKFSVTVFCILLICCAISAQLMQNVEQKANSESSDSEKTLLNLVSKFTLNEKQWVICKIQMTIRLVKQMKLHKI